MNVEQTQIASVLSAYGIRKHMLRFTAHRVSFASAVAARLAIRHRTAIEQSLPGWVLTELETSSYASHTVLARASTVEPDDEEEVEETEQTWLLTARDVRPGMTIRLVDKPRPDRLLGEWQRVVRIKHDRDGHLWFIGVDEAVLGRWGPATRFERQPEPSGPASVATGRLDRRR